MKVLLTRKYAEWIDGIDLRAFAVGDTLDLSTSAARILLAEHWAKRERRKAEQPSRSRRRASDRR